MQKQSAEKNKLIVTVLPNPKVNFYFATTKKWQQELEQLRTIVLACGLTEELKWGNPCYVLEKKNIVLIHAFKEYCAVLFFKGALLNNAKGLLIQQTANVQAARQMRFTSIEEVMRSEKFLKASVYEAVEVEKAGLKVPLKNTAAFNIPEELQLQLNKKSGFKKAFEALTPGRQRGYIFYFSQPKQAKTRQARVEKYMPQILKGIGLNDL